MLDIQLQVHKQQGRKIDHPCATLQKAKQEASPADQATNLS
jgi:hypothetical protein